MTLPAQDIITYSTYHPQIVKWKDFNGVKERTQSNLQAIQIYFPVVNPKPHIT